MKFICFIFKRQSIKKIEKENLVILIKSEIDSSEINFNQSEVTVVATFDFH